MNPGVLPSGSGRVHGELAGTKTPGVDRLDIDAIPDNYPGGFLVLLVASVSNSVCIAYDLPHVVSFDPSY